MRIKGKKGFFIENYEDLSTRSRNILDLIGGVEGMLKHFLKFHTFLNIKNSGTRTNIELSSFSEYLLKNTEVNNDEKVEEIEGQLIDNGVSTIVNSYYLLKDKLSVRANNILESLRDSFDTDTHSFVLSITNDEIDFLKIRNCGRKTKQELEEFAQKLKSNKQECSPTIDIDPRIILVSKVGKIFTQLPFKLIENLFDKEKVELSKFLCALIYFNDYKESKSIVIREYYFHERKISFEDLAKLSGLTRERVRQLIKEFVSSDLPKIASLVNRKLHDYVEVDKVFLNDNILIDVDLDLSIDDGDNVIKPNNRLITELLRIIAPQNFIPFSEFYSKVDSKRDMISIENTFNVFINKDCIKKYKLHELFCWCNEEIYNFEKFAVEYDMEVLLRRFFVSEFQIDINIRDLRILSNFLQENKRSIVGTVIERRGVKELRRMEIYNLCYSYIENKGVPIKTGELLQMLFENNIDASTQELLKLLNNNRDQFSTFGHGTWAISTWRLDGLVGGSLRDIVVSKLNSSKLPLHISELLVYISKFRKVNLRSLLTNLKSEENGIFIFFNCNFIGLKSKTYDQYWHNIPRVNGRHFVSDFISNAEKKNKNVAAYYEELYGYPKINTEFLLNGSTIESLND